MLASVLPEPILQKGQSALNVFSSCLAFTLARVNSLWSCSEQTTSRFFKKLKKQVVVHVEWRRGSSAWESTRLNNAHCWGWSWRPSCRWFKSCPRHHHIFFQKRSCTKKVWALIIVFGVLDSLKYWLRSVLKFYSNLICQNGLNYFLWNNYDNCCFF